MQKLKELQGQLIRYFKQGNDEDIAKEKVKKLSEDFTFLEIPIREYIDEINEDKVTFNSLVMFSDMGLIGQLRKNIIKIKEAQVNFKGEYKIDKAMFQAQYLQYLKEKFKSDSIAKSRLKRIAIEMKDLGCQIGEHLEGITSTNNISSIEAMSGLGLIENILNLRNKIKEKHDMDNG